MPELRTTASPWLQGAAILVGAAGLSANLAARAQDAIRSEEVAAQATDPTAALMPFQLNDWYTSSFHDADGFGDLTVFDLTTFDRSWGRFGVGISGTLPTGAEGLTPDKWTAGPALGFVNSSVKRVDRGVFAKTFFSYAGDPDAPDVGLINFQPVLSCQLGLGRSLSIGNSALVYDTEHSRWSSLLLSVNYGLVVGWAGQKWRPNFEVGYDFKNDPGNRDWVLRAGVALPVPAAM